MLKCITEANILMNFIVATSMNSQNYGSYAYDLSMVRQLFERATGGFILPFSHWFTKLQTRNCTI